MPLASAPTILRSTDGARTFTRAHLPATSIRNGYVAASPRPATRWSPAAGPVQGLTPDLPYGARPTLGRPGRGGRDQPPTSAGWEVIDVVSSPTGTVAALTWNQELRSQLWRSADAGRTWTPINDVAPTLASQDPLHLVGDDIVLTNRSGPNRPVATSDGGRSWRSLGPIPAIKSPPSDLTDGPLINRIVTAGDVWLADAFDHPQRRRGTPSTHPFGRPRSIVASRPRLVVLHGNDATEQTSPIIRVGRHLLVAALCFTRERGETRLFQSNDRGAHWQRTGPTLDASVDLLATTGPAQGNPHHRREWLRHRPPVRHPRALTATRGEAPFEAPDPVRDRSPLHPARGPSSAPSADAAPAPLRRRR